MSRRSTCSLFLILACLAIFAGVITTTTIEARQTVSGAQVASLQQQLKFGLKARLPRELEFINEVVSLVQQQKLPLRDVNAIFKWARKKRPYQMPYFEYAMRRHALARYRIKL